MLKILLTARFSYSNLRTKKMKCFTLKTLYQNGQEVWASQRRPWLQTRFEGVKYWTIVGLQ